MYKNRAYIIRTKTNLHVGSDGTNFGIVDKEVQRDTITNIPVINASSLKGAIRDHFSDMLAATNDLPIGSDAVKPFVFRTIFGDEQKEDTPENRKKVSEKDKAKLLNKEDYRVYNKLPKHGLVKFLDAKLLFLPLRSNKKPFYHVTSIATLEEMQNLLESFGIKLSLGTLKAQKRSVVVDKEMAVVEDVECESTSEDFSQLKEFFGIKNLAIFNDEDFNEAVSNLPVIARNKVATKADKSDSNLWYEEVVPRESIFYTTLCYYDNLDDATQDKRNRADRRKFENAYKLFEEKLLKDDIQIGANTSIGYGICNFVKRGASDE